MADAPSTAHIFCHGGEQRDGAKDTVARLIYGGIGRCRGSPLGNHSSITYVFGRFSSFTTGRGSCSCRGGSSVSVCCTLRIALNEQLCVCVCGGGEGVCNRCYTKSRVTSHQSPSHSYILSRYHNLSPRKIAHGGGGHNVDPTTRLEVTTARLYTCTLSLRHLLINIHITTWEVEQVMTNQWSIFPPQFLQIGAVHTTRAWEDSN